MFNFRNATQYFDFEWPEGLHNQALGKSKSESYACTVQRVPLLNSRECEYRLAPASRWLLEWGCVFSTRGRLSPNTDPSTQKHTGQIETLDDPLPFGSKNAIQEALTHALRGFFPDLHEISKLSFELGWDTSLCAFAYLLPKRWVGECPLETCAMARPDGRIGQRYPGALRYRCVHVGSVGADGQKRLRLVNSED